MRSGRQGRGGRKANTGHFHREASHRESHARHEEHLGPIATHPMASPETPVIVKTAPGLAEMIDRLAAAKAFAFDSEFIGERSYEPQLCLVQMATAQNVFVVDPLAGLDLSDVWRLLVSPTVEKTVLAGQQDFGPAVQQTGRPPTNIVDVQIAAGFVHPEYPLSLARLLQEFLGVSLGKALTFTHWDQRPLSAVQLRYAADDVRYLPAARDAIGKRLADLGRTAWAREECEAALEDMSAYRPAAESLYLRVRGRDRLGRRELAVLRELAIVRDQAARREDVPTRTLLKDGILVTLARRPARRLTDLDRIKGLPRPVESRYGERIVEATAKAMALQESQLPPTAPIETPTSRDQADKIWVEINRFCQERSIAPSLVASRKEIARVCQAVASGQPLGRHRLLRGWRKQLLGDLLARLL